MLDYAVRPMTTWPGARTEEPRSSPFRARWRQTLQLLEHELRQLGADRVIIEAFVEPRHLRLDGGLRADAQPTRPGIVLSFETRFGPMRFPCDAFTNWQDNVRAVALALEALRKVQRYGVGRYGEQYRGWDALPEKPQNQDDERFCAAAFIAEHAGDLNLADGILSDPEARTKAYRVAAKKLHPDSKEGSDELFRILVESKELLDGKNGRTEPTE